MVASFVCVKLRWYPLGTSSANLLAGCFRLGEMAFDPDATLDLDSTLEQAAIDPDATLPLSEGASTYAGGVGLDPDMTMDLEADASTPPAPCPPIITELSMGSAPSSSPKIQTTIDEIDFEELELVRLLGARTLVLCFVSRDPFCQVRAHLAVFGKADGEEGKSAAVSGGVMT